MKKIFTLTIFIQFAIAGFISAQCSSGAASYDLIVNTVVSIPQTGPSFTFAIICNGGNLYDSAQCCTRMIHVNPGGIYQAGPMAYGMLYIKSGGTFDAHGNNNFFGVYYESGATILNYSGPMTLCTSVLFDSTACLTTNISESTDTSPISVYPDPCSDVLTFESSSFSAGAMLRVYDISGKRILEYSFLNAEKNQVDISSLAPGIYSYAIKGNATSDVFGKFAVVR